jgi:hypothetical protein
MSMKFEYLTLEYKFNREKHLIFGENLRNSYDNYKTYTLNELGNEGWELIEKFENLQTSGMIANRIAVFMREK